MPAQHHAHEHQPGPTVIREATEADLPRLVELLYQLSQLGERPEDIVQPVTPVHVAALHELQADPRATCLVVECDGRVEGTLTVYILPNLSHGGKRYALVENLVVDESRRGRGYGRLLMERAEALARERGCYRLGLTSNRRRTDAHRFYERLGFMATHHGFTKYFV